MDTIKFTGIVGKNRRLKIEIELPDDAPMGKVEGEVSIRAVANGEASTPENGQPVSAETLTREEVRRRLKAAGLLSDYTYAPPDIVELSEEEELELGRLLAQRTSILDIINEDRGEY